MKKKKKKKEKERQVHAQLTLNPLPPLPTMTGISSPADSPRLIEQRGIQLTIGQFHSSTILTLSTVKNTPRKNTIPRRVVDPIEGTRSIQHIYIYFFKTSIRSKGRARRYFRDNPRARIDGLRPPLLVVVPVRIHCLWCI